MRAVLTMGVTVCAVLWAAQFSYAAIFAAASIACALAALADWRTARTFTPKVRDHVDPPPDPAAIFDDIAKALGRKHDDPVSRQ